MASKPLEIPKHYFESPVVPTEVQKPKGVVPAVNGVFQQIRAGVSKSFNKHGVGLYPPEYNVKIHGPYQPFKYYGKPDPISDVKIGELPAWFMRRNYHPTAMWREANRLGAVWKRNWFYPRRAGAAGMWQFAMATSILFYMLTYKTQRAEKVYKYH